jgi:hypothetical protein
MPDLDDLSVNQKCDLLGGPVMQAMMANFAHLLCKPVAEPGDPEEEALRGLQRAQHAAMFILNDLRRIQASPFFLCDTP